MSAVPYMFSTNSGKGRHQVGYVTAVGSQDPWGPEKKPPQMSSARAGTGRLVLLLFSVASLVPSLSNTSIARCQSILEE